MIFYNTYFGARYYDAEIGKWLSVDPLAHKYPLHSPYNYVLNNPVVAIDEEGKDVVVVVGGEVNRVVTNYNYSSQWDQGPRRPADRHFATYNMDVYDYGDQQYMGGDSESNGISWLTEHSQFEVARDAWNDAERSEHQFGTNNEIAPMFGEISDRAQETANTRGRRNGWLGVNDVGQIGGTILSGPDGARYGISIHPGNSNFAQGCLTMDRQQFNQLISIVRNAISNGQTVYIMIQGRRARYNEGRWEYVVEEENEDKR